MLYEVITVGAVTLHRAHADAKQLGDLAVGVALGDMFEYLEFALREGRLVALDGIAAGWLSE